MAGRRRVIPDTRVRREARDILFEYLENIRLRTRKRDDDGLSLEPVTLEEVDVAWKTLKLLVDVEDTAATGVKDSDDDEDSDSDEPEPKPDVTKVSDAQLRKLLKGMPGS